MTETHLGYDFPYWVTGLKIYTLAKRTTRDKEKYTVSNFGRGRGAEFTVREFYNLRDIFIHHGLMVPVNPDDLLKGFMWTVKGWEFLWGIMEYYETPLSPTEE